MGYTRNRFFIVHSSYDAETIVAARSKAVEIFGELVSPVMKGVINDESGFMVWTSGSKAYWPEDHSHQESLRLLVGALRLMERPPRWVLVVDGEEVGDLTAEHGYDGNYDHKYKTARVAPQ